MGNIVEKYKAMVKSNIIFCPKCGSRMEYQPARDMWSCKACDFWMTRAFLEDSLDLIDKILFTHKAFVFR